MRDPANHRRLLSDLRFALDVLEERSHIGLNDESAAKVRRALLHRIAEAEKALGHPPSSDLGCDQNANEVATA